MARIRQFLPIVAATTLLVGLLTAPGARAEGKYSVLVVANVDHMTATSTIEKLVAAGYDQFVKEGSKKSGFDVHMPGLTREEARQIAAEVKGETGYAMAWETAKLP